jgi:hypothetical protein
LVSFIAACSISNFQTNAFAFPSYVWAAEINRIFLIYIALQPNKLPCL